MPLYRASGSFANLTVTGAALGEASPATHGVVAWANDPAHNVNSSLLTNGTVYVTAVYPAKDASITKLYTHIPVAAVTATAGQNWLGVYSSAGTRLQQVGIDSEVTTTGLITGTITAQAVTAGSFYWVAIVANASTAPTLARASGVTGIGAVANLGLTAATYRFGIAATAQTTLPASFTPSSNTATSFAGPWAAIG